MIIKLIKAIRRNLYPVIDIQTVKPIVYINGRVLRYRIKIVKEFGEDWIHGMVIDDEIMIKAGEMSDTLIRHELLHVLQFRHQGPIRYLIKYLWNHIRVGYHHIPEEQQAYRGEVSRDAFMREARKMYPDIKVVW